MWNIKKILKYFQFYFTISLLSPLGKERGPSFEHTLILSTQRCFVQSLVQIGPVVLEKTILKYFQFNFTFLLFSPLGEGLGPAFEQTWILSTQAWPFIWTNLNSLHPKMLCAKFGSNWPTGSGEEVENVKRFQTDRGRQTTGYQKSSLELSAQVS